MKKFLAIAGSILLAVLLAFTTVFLVLKSKQGDRETSAFVTDTINSISDGWHARELVARAEPGLIKAMSSHGQTLSELFSVYRKLGNLTTAPDCHLKDTSQFEGTTDSYITASYSCEAEYDNGHATILITLRHGKTDTAWKVYYINVSSPYFSEIGYQPSK